MIKFIKKWSLILLVDFLIALEIFLISWLCILVYPIQSQKLYNAFMDITCPKPVQTYYFNIKYSWPFEKAELLDLVNELNLKLDFQVFKYSNKSKNLIIFEDVIDKKRTNEIGLTSCSSICCGNDHYSVEFTDSWFYDRLRAKLLVWHEFGHIAGLNHDDSMPDIMNSYQDEVYGHYDQDIENRFINKMKKKLGLK